MSKITFSEAFTRFKEDNYNFVLLGILIFHSIIFTIFQALDKTYQTWDSAGHIGMSYNIAEEIKLFLMGKSSMLNLLRISDYYPPFVQTVGALVALVFGYDSNLILAITLIFYLIAITFLYIDIKLLTKSSRIALLSALVFSLFPETFEQSRVFQLDLPLVALLLITFYFFIKSNCLQSLKYTILFALFFSFAQLTKWYGFLYLAGPCLSVAFVYIKDKRLNYPKLIKNLAAYIGIVLLVAVPWYIANFNKLIEYSSIFSAGEIDDPQAFWSLYNFSYYFTRILSHQIFFLPCILLVCGLVSLYFRNKRNFVFAIGSIFIPLAVFTIVGNKNLRYIYPFTPLFAYIIVDFLYHLPEKMKLVSKPLKGIFVFYILSAFFFTSFNQLQPHQEILKPIGVYLSGPYYNVWYNEPTLFSYDATYWPIKEVWDYIRDDSGNFQTGFGVTPLFDKKNLSLATIELVRRENKYYRAFVPVPYFQFEPFKTDKDILDYFDKNSVEYVLVTDDPGPEGLRNYAVLSQMSRYLLSRKNKTFEMIKTFDLPDNTQMRVFKKLPPGKTIENNINVSCKPDAGIDTGIEHIQLKKNHTYVFYTGNYAVDRFIGNFEEGKLYILQIENVPNESILDVYNLPHVGTSMCSFDDLDIDLSESIVRPLVESSNCGVDCQTVDYVKWSVGGENTEEKVYTRENVAEFFPELVAKFAAQAPEPVPAPAPAAAEPSPVVKPKVTVTITKKPVKKPIAKEPAADGIEAPQ